MAPTVNPRWIGALSGLFGSAEGADCEIQFCLEGGEETGRGAALGPPLPAHSFVLRLACERFSAQFDRWTRRQPSSGKPASRQRPRGLRVRVQPLKKVLWPQHLRKPATRKPLRLKQRKSTGPQPAHKPDGRPLLRVPLGSEAEVPAARLALRFAYTGQVLASSIREALEVLRAGDYLAIEGCATACSQWLADRLAATGAAEAAGSSAAPAEPAVLQLFACDELWPSDDSGFAAVLSAAKPQLVRHFGSTLATLNSSALTKQLEGLGPKGLEALLESDDLGTDSEDSVLTLLAMWMRANWARTDAATRKRLCGLVRLTQLSPQAVSCLLLPLAADHETMGPEHQAGWFTLSVTKAILVVSYHAASELFQKGTREEQAAAGSPGWHSASPRKQCVPAEGMAFPWSISKEEVKAKLQGLQPGQTTFAFATFSNGAAAVRSRGLAWEVKVEYGHGKAAAGLFLRAQIPDAFKVPGSRLAGPMPKLDTCIDAHLTVNRRQGGEVSVVPIMTYGKADFTCVGSGWGLAKALPLSPQRQAAEAAPAGDFMAGWAEYAHEGSAVTGTLTLLPPNGLEVLGYAPSGTYQVPGGDEAQHLSYRGPPYGNMPHVQEMLPQQQFVVAPNGQVMVGQAPLFASPYALDVSGMYGMPPGSAVLRPATALTSSLAPVAYSPATASAARQQLAMQQQAAMLGAPLMYGSPQPAQPMVLNLTLTPPERWRRHQQRAASPSTWDDAALMGGGSGSGRNVWNGAAGGTVDPEPWLPAHMRTPPPAPRPPLRMPVALTLQPNTSPAAAVVESASSPQQREGQQGLGQGQGQLGAQGSSLKGLRSQWSAWAGHESPDQRRRSACRYPGDGSSAGGAAEPCSPTRHGPGVGGIASVSGGAPPLRPPRQGVRAGAGLGAVARPLPPFVGAGGLGLGVAGLPQGVAQGSGLDLRALGLGAPRYAPGLQLLPGAAGRGSAGGRSTVGAGSVDS